MTRLYRFALLTNIATFTLIALGSLARLQPAGSGCGNDWPRCSGSWLPEMEWPALLEYAHRLTALTVVLLALVTAVLAYTTPATSRRVRNLATTAVGIILLQGGIGGLAATWAAPAGIAIAHLLLAMLFVAIAAATVVAVAADQGRPRWLTGLGPKPGVAVDRTFALAAALGAVAALAIVVFGASTSASGAFACATWPFCADTGAADGVNVIHLGYTASALLGSLAAGGVAVLAWRRRASETARLLASMAVGIVVVQTALNVGAATIGDPVWASSPHLLVGSLLWLTMLGVAASAWGPQEVVASDRAVITDTRSVDASVVDAGPASPFVSGHAAALALPSASMGVELPVSTLFTVQRVVADYVALTKPGIMSLLLTTTLCAMLMAERGLPPFWLVAVTMLGGILASGGANVLNCYIDRDIDGQMSRTRNRATAAGRVSAEAALTFGITLTVAAVLLLGLTVNWTAAALALAGNLFYVFVYTRWLKRTTPYNIVIGGAAGAVPPLVGWAAVTGNLTPLAWGLFAVIFAWTPPHFWALALLKQGEYTRASVPMLPVVRGEAETRRQIVLYTIVLVAVCLALTPLGLGAVYFVSALILNGVFFLLAVRLYRNADKRSARQLFFYSLWFLAFLFAAAVVDRIVLS
jgi:protoheme IX farnesyltransferase